MPDLVANRLWGILFYARRIRFILRVSQNAKNDVPLNENAFLQPVLEFCHVRRTLADWLPTDPTM
jgi:hypothetical protein